MLKSVYLEVVFMFDKEVLYLDLDDTVKDTERYIRRVLQSNGIQLAGYQGSIYYLMNTDTLAGSLVSECLKEWEVIPFKSCAYNAIKLLQTEYNIVFCSSYTFQREAEMKRVFAKAMGCDIILCGEEHRFKDHVDMSQATFIDDRSDILLRSNAKAKFELLNPYFFDSCAERDDKTLLVDWYSLVDILMGKGINQEEIDKDLEVLEGGSSIEKLRGLLCQGV